MRFDQSLNLNETWHKLDQGPMRDDSADSLQEKHLVRHLNPPSTPASALLGHMPLAQVCFHRAQCPVAAIKLHSPRFASANKYGPGQCLISCSDPDMICYVWILMQESVPAR